MREEPRVGMSPEVAALPPGISPEQIGERRAREEWLCKGRALLTLSSTYSKALHRLGKECPAPEARRAFDRVLGQLAADSIGILRPRLPKTPKAKRRPTWA